MILLYVKGIPHWFDGKIALPVMAGGDLTDEQLAQIFGAGTTPEAEQRAAEAAARAARGELTLDWLNDRTFIDPSTGRVGLIKTELKNGIQRWHLVDADGKRYPIRQAAQLYDPRTHEMFSVGPVFGPNNNRNFTVKSQELDDKQHNALLKQLGLSSGDGSPEHDYAADAAAQELENLRFQHDLALAAENNRHAQEAAKLAAENQLRRDKLSDAALLTRNFLDNQQKTRALIAELTGVDPIAATVAAFGGVQRGTTQAQAAMQANRNFVNQAVPTVDENAAIPQIQSTIDQLRQAGQPPVMPSIGFAQGGLAGYGNPQFGTNKTAILVGEEGTPPLAPGTEVQITGPEGVEVIPLTTQGGLGMQEGGFDPNSIRGALAPFYGSLGFQGNVPTAQRGDFGFTFGPTTFGGRTIGGGETARMLGYKPRLIRDIVSGATYYTNPQGILQRIATPDVFKQAGFNQQDVFNVTSEEIPGFGQIGADLNAPPPQIESPMQRGQPLLSPPESGSIPLPNLPALASALRGLRRYLDPNIWTLISSIYGRAGLGTPQTALDVIQQTQRQYQPVGTQTRAGAARLG